MDYARAMLTQVEGNRGERRFRDHIYEQAKNKWEGAAKDHNDLRESKANLVRGGVKGLGDLDSIIDTARQIAGEALAELKRAKEEVDKLEEVERNTKACASAAFDAVPRSSCSPIEYAILHTDFVTLV